MFAFRLQYSNIIRSLYAAESFVPRSFSSRPFLIPAAVAEKRNLRSADVESLSLSLSLSLSFSLSSLFFDPRELPPRVCSPFDSRNTLPTTSSYRVSRRLLVMRERSRNKPRHIDEIEDPCLMEVCSSLEFKARNRGRHAWEDRKAKVRVARYFLPCYRVFLSEQQFIFLRRLL